MNICFIIGSNYVPDDEDFDFSLFDVDKAEEQSAPLTSELLTLATSSVSRKQKPTNFAKTCSCMLPEVIARHVTVHLG